MDAVVVGAGAAGLAAALELQRRGLDVRLLEAGEAVGGVMRSERTGGFLVERGPNSMQGKASVRPFLDAHGLEPLLLPAAPASRLRFLWHEGRLEKVPLGPLAFARTPLLSGRGKLRLLAEPCVAGGDGSAETVAAFVRRRLGDEALERLVAPFLTGVYAGDEAQLGAAAVFGSLVDLEAAHGSIGKGFLRAAFSKRTGPRPLRGSFSSADGLGGLAARLAARLGERVVMGARVTALARDARGWRIESDGAGELRSARVLLALPAQDAAGLLQALEPEAAAALRSLVYAPIVSISLGVGSADTAHPVEGFGFLVPKGGGLDLLGCLFMSQLFPGRAPAGMELLTCFLGGARWPEALDEPDEALLARLFRDLARSLGLRGTPRPLAITRWPRAVAQPGASHRAVVADIRRRVGRRRGLALAGSFMDGVSLADTLACGAAAARGLVEGAEA